MDVGELNVTTPQPALTARALWKPCVAYCAGEGLFGGDVPDWLYIKVSSPGTVSGLPGTDGAVV